MYDVSDKLAVITGGTRGIGLEIARHLLTAGAKVVVNDLGSSADGSGASYMADQVVEDIRKAGGIAIANKASVSDRVAAKSIVDDAVS